ncbi:MAG: ABC transporter substrate-binding protein [Verrucomicrobiota bacterium]
MSQHYGRSRLLQTITFCLVGFSTTAFAEKTPRIVTVGGASTEIVFALGSGDQVIAVDLSSTYPAQVRQLPQVGYIRSVSPEGILSMGPDLIITTETLGPPAAKEMMKQIELPVVWLPEPSSYQTLETSVNSVAEKLNKTDEAKSILTKVSKQIDDAKTNAAGWSSTPTVLFFLQPPGNGRPGMAAGAESRADSLILMAGGSNAGADFKGFKEVSAESIVEMNPDVILIGLSPGHGGTPESVEEVKASPALSAVKAVNSGHVYGVPLDDLNFGPRLGDAVTRWNGLLAPVAQ